MSVSPIIAGAQGIAYGLTFTQAKRIEDSVRAGENAYLTSILQFVQGTRALLFADNALIAAGKSAVAWPLRAVTCLTPFLIAIAKKNNLVPENIRPALVFMQNHLSTLFEIIAVVSSVVMIFFGHTVFGVAALVVLAIGFMDRNGILPEKMRQFLHRYCEPVLMVAGLICGGIIDRIFCILNLAAWGTRLYFSCVKTKTPVEVLPEHNLDVQKMHDFRGGLNFSVNRKHIHANALPPIPDIDIEIFLQQFDQINWAHHIHALREKFRQDPRFIERHRNPDQKTDPEILAIARASLTAFIHAVKEHRILAGEPVDYDKLHNYLKIIGKYVQDGQDEIIKADVLMRLSVEGGEYCGPGKYEAAESIFAQVVSDSAAIPLRDKVLHCLQDERNRWMQAFYARSMQRNPVANIADWLDIHMYNTFVNCYGDRFGLRKTAAENDESAIVDPLVKGILTLALQKLLDRGFWAEHQMTDLVRALLPSIGTPQLPKPEIYAYWQAWIERQQIPEEAKQMLRDELAEPDHPRLFGRPFEENGQFSEPMIALMLFDMGIFEIDAGANAVNIAPEPAALLQRQELLRV